MFFPPRNIVEKVKEEYPTGTRVELVELNDPYRQIEKGTRGTVSCVDDTATIHVDWDNGCHLGVVYGEDSCKKLNTVKTVCYGEEQVWDSREEACAFFLMGMAASNGAENQRYTKIYTELMMGNDVCTDEER
jgi:hypothetical protein